MKEKETDDLRSRILDEAAKQFGCQRADVYLIKD